MSKGFTKIVIWLFSVLAIFLYVLITFSAKKDTISRTFNLSSSYSWVYEVQIKNDEIDYVQNEATASRYKDKNVYVDFITDLDQVFFSFDGKQKKYKSSINSTNIDISIWEWLYFFSLNDEYKKYTINSTDFSINTLSNAKFFVYSSNWNISVISLDWVIDLMVKNPKTKTNIKNMVIYPHMHVSFSQSIITALREIDYLKFINVFSITYIKESLFDKKWEINNKFLDSIFDKDDLSTKNVFLKTVFQVLQKNQVESRDRYNDLKNVHYTTIPWEEYIIKHFNFLLNKEKKVIFLKNNVLKNTSDLFKNTKKQKDKEDIIIADLTEIKSLSDIEYKEILELLKWYYNLMVLNNDSNIEIIKESFKNIVIATNPELSKNLKVDAYLYLSSIYNSYDTQTLENPIHSYLQVFLEKYFKLKKIENIDTRRTVVVDDKTKQDLLYLSNYLMYFLLNDFDVEKSIKNLNYLLDIYYKLNTNVVYAENLNFDYNYEIQRLETDFAAKKVSQIWYDKRKIDLKNKQYTSDTEKRTLWMIFYDFLRNYINKVWWAYFERPVQWFTRDSDNLLVYLNKDLNMWAFRPILKQMQARFDSIWEYIKTYKTPVVWTVEYNQMRYRNVEVDWFKKMIWELIIAFQWYNYYKVNFSTESLLLQQNQDLLRQNAAFIWQNLLWNSWDFSSLISKWFNFTTSNTTLSSTNIVSFSDVPYKYSVWIWWIFEWSINWSYDYSTKKFTGLMLNTNLGYINLTKTLDNINILQDIDVMANNFSFLQAVTTYIWETIQVPEYKYYVTDNVLYPIRIMFVINWKNVIIDMKEKNIWALFVNSKNLLTAPIDYSTLTTYYPQIQ